MVYHLDNLLWVSSLGHGAIGVPGDWLQDFIRSRYYKSEGHRYECGNRPHLATSIKFFISSSPIKLFTFASKEYWPKLNVPDKRARETSFLKNNVFRSYVFPSGTHYRT